MFKVLGVNLLLTAVGCFGLEVLARAFAGVRNVGPAFTQYDPVYGKSFKPSFSAERADPEFRMRLTTNSRGRRGPEPQGPETGGILLLGDSFTEGYGVNDGQEYAALLRQALARRHAHPPPPVLNTGMSNTGNGRSLKILQREAPRLAPKVVVLQVMDNDFGDNHKEHLFEWVDGQLREVAGPAIGQPSRLGIHVIVETIPGLAHSHLIAGLRQGLWGRSARHFYPRSAAGDELTYHLWDRIFDVCRDEGWPLVVLAVNLHETRLARLRQTAQARHLPLLVPPTPAERPDLYYAMDQHWNQRGHQVVAAKLLSALDQLDVWPSPLPGAGHPVPSALRLPPK